MNNNNTDHQSPITTVIRILVVIEAVTFLIAAVSHLGVEIPLGFAVLEEPQIVPATIVEGLCGIFLAISTYALFTHRDWAWPAALAAHVFAIAGVLVGITALAVGAGPRTTLNDIYHGVILAVLVVNAGLLLAPAAKTSLGGHS